VKSIFITCQQIKKFGDSGEIRRQYIIFASYLDRIQIVKNMNTSVKQVIRNILAVAAGLITGSVVNIALVQTGSMVIPAPAGADVSTLEGLKASMPLFTPVNFLFPFLAHALGTFTGALLAAVIAANRKRMFAAVIGSCFLVGGIINIIMLPSPLWFTLLDLVVAYLPMGYLAGRLVTRKKE
jgi:hypothetical protein